MGHLWTTPTGGISADYLLEVKKGNVPGSSIVNKFGHNDSAGTSFEPVSIGGIYLTPQASGATTLRIKSGGNANDTAAGSGAREIMLVGLDENFVEQTETIATAGASASSATTVTFTRLYRVFVSAAGSYASASAGSHNADIVIENGSGGTDWATISATDFPRAQSQIGVYSVQAAMTAYVLGFTVQVESNKPVDIIFFGRGGINETAAPYSAMRMLFQANGLEDSLTFNSQAAFGPVPAYYDLGFMAKVATGTGKVTVDFEMLVVDD